MMRRIITAVIFFSVFTGTARAILPPDAATRTRQIRNQHYYIRQTYEKRLEDRQAEAIQAYEKAESDIFTPPWLRAGTHTAVLNAADAEVVKKIQVSKKRNHRILVSAMLLILISAAAAWVRHITREIDRQDS